jgi:hemoglobin
VASHFEQLGGEPVLRVIISRFVDRVFEDVMIGFFFARADRQRIKDKEFEFAAAHLGAAVVYSGRPLQVAHGQHAIMGGHFMRRMQLLRETLTDFGVPSEIRDAWLQHNLDLQPVITAVPGSECRNEAVEQRTLADKPAATHARGSRPLPVTAPHKPKKDPT